MFSFLIVYIEINSGSGCLTQKRTSQSQNHCDVFVVCTWGIWFFVLFLSCHWGSGGGLGRNSLQVCTESFPVHFFPHPHGRRLVPRHLKRILQKSLRQTAGRISRACLFELSQEKGSVSFLGSSPWPFPPFFCLPNPWLPKWPLDTPCLPHTTELPGTSVSLLDPSLGVLLTLNGLSNGFVCFSH